MKIWFILLKNLINFVLFKTVLASRYGSSLYKDMTTLRGTSTKLIVNYSFDELANIPKFKCFNRCSANQKFHASEIINQLCRVLIVSPGSNGTILSNINSKVYVKVQNYYTIFPNEPQQTQEPASIRNLTIVNSFKVNKTGAYPMALSLINDLVIVGLSNGAVEIWNRLALN